MSITQNASRIRIESAAKNGTLGSQSGLGVKQIKFDTAITTNNGDLESSPTFKGRYVVVRRGQSDEETNPIKSVDPDGLTCTCLNAWDSGPASGDSYDVSYVLDDVATIAGCDKESGTRQYAFTKRLVIGDAVAFAFFGMGDYQMMRMADSGPTTDAIRIMNNGCFSAGAVKKNQPVKGGLIIFTNDGDGESVMTCKTGSTANVYDTTFYSAFKPDGVAVQIDVESGITSDIKKASRIGVVVQNKKFPSRRQQYLEWFRDDWRLQLFTSGAQWKARLRHLGTGEEFVSTPKSENDAYKDVRDQWYAKYGPGV